MNDGGPAFPRPGYVMSQDCDPEQWVSGSNGMSLRDYFAAHCMADVLSHFSWRGVEIKKAAKLVWELADVMLAERDSETPSDATLLQQQTYAWLGQWRDKLPADSVKQLQNVLGPLEK